MGQRDSGAVLDYLLFRLPLVELLVCLFRIARVEGHSDFAPSENAVSPKLTGAFDLPRSPGLAEVGTGPFVSAVEGEWCGVVPKVSWPRLQCGIGSTLQHSFLRPQLISMLLKIRWPVIPGAAVALSFALASIENLGTQISRRQVLAFVLLVHFYDRANELGTQDRTLQVGRVARSGEGFLLECAERVFPTFFSCVLDPVREWFVVLLYPTNTEKNRRDGHSRLSMRIRTKRKILIRQIRICHQSRPRVLASPRFSNISAL
jgi:hypothetical protein